MPSLCSSRPHHGGLAIIFLAWHFHTPVTHWQREGRKYQPKPPGREEASLGKQPTCLAACWFMPILLQTSFKEGDRSLSIFSNTFLSFSGLNKALQACHQPLLRACAFLFWNLPALPPRASCRQALVGSPEPPQAHPTPAPHTPPRMGQGGRQYRCNDCKYRGRLRSHQECLQEGRDPTSFKLPTT